MLSLPEDWDYTLAGLSHINREKIDAIREAVKELEKAGYIVRSRERDEKGRLRGADYIIYEQPHPPAEQADENAPPPVLDLPTLENPILDNPTQEKPMLENPTQLNKDISSKEEKNTDVSNNDQSIYPAQPEDAPPFGGIDGIDGNSAVAIYRDIIKENIEYDYLIQDPKMDRERLDEVVELILETVCSTAKYIKVGGEKYPAELVKSRLMKVGSSHIEYVFDRISSNTTKVYNIRAYLLKTLFSAPSTMGHFYTAEVNHDLYGGEY